MPVDLSYLDGDHHGMEYLNELAADIASAWDLHIEYSNNEPRRSIQPNNTKMSAEDDPSRWSSMTSLFKRGVRSTPEVHARGPVLTTINSVSAPDLDISITNSAPPILVHSPSADVLNAIPIKSIMVARTLEESLHGPRRYTSPSSMSQSQHERTALRRGTITFGQVNIREYERVLGDNPSVTSGPPLSIGWRYSPSTLNMSIDDYEENKGSPRSSSEYLVPKSIRLATLKEHADIPHREIANAVRAIQKTKSQRRKTVVNLSMASTEELVEGAKIKVKSILRPSLSYSLSETKLWDEAHARATEKARELEESLQPGNGISKRDLLSVGTPIVIIPSRRNSSIDNSDGRSVPISSSADAPQSTAKSGSTTNQVNTTSTWINDGKHKNRTMSLSPKRGLDGDRTSSTVGDSSSFNGSIDMQDEAKLDSTATTTGGVRSNSIIIVETSDDNEEDMLSRLLLDDAQDVK